MYEDQKNCQLYICHERIKSAFMINHALKQSCKFKQFPNHDENLLATRSKSYYKPFNYST